MAEFGTWGIFIILLVVLCFIIFCLYKEHATAALFLGLALLITIPLWLDKVILYQWYLCLPWNSSREPEEWMDFLGSYLGVAGTIVAGALAYWQTRVNRKQDEEIAKQRDSMETQNQEIRELQRRLATYQIHPVICFDNGTMQGYAGSQNFETNRNEYGKIYYNLRGRSDFDDFGCNLCFVHIAIPFRDRGIVPSEEAEIEKVRWSIADKIYDIELRERKYAIVSDQLQILIDHDDRISAVTREGKKEGSGESSQDFFTAVITHQEYYRIGRYGYDKSQLQIEVKFFNQVAESRTYQMNYRIYPEKSAEKLLLNNLHMIILEGRNDRTNGANK